MGIILRKSTKKEFVAKQLDLIFSTVKHSSQLEREVSAFIYISIDMFPELNLFRNECCQCKRDQLQSAVRNKSCNNRFPFSRKTWIGSKKGIQYIFLINGIRRSSVIKVPESNFSASYQRKHLKLLFRAIPFEILRGRDFIFFPFPPPQDLKWNSPK